MRLEGKVALVTGGGSGVGYQTALLFASEGARVVVSDLKEYDAVATADHITATGGQAIPVSVDVTNNNDCYRMVKSALSAYGRLDVLVNSAGVTDRNALTSGASPEMVWDRVIEVNLKGTYLACYHTVPEMKKAGGGSIVNLGSIGSLVGFPADRDMGLDPYPPSKGGVMQFTRNLAVDLARNRIRVNCICPGHLFTNLTERLTQDTSLMASLLKKYPMGRIGQPKEIAYGALFLASDEASFVTGVPLIIDGGYTAQ